MTLSKRQTLSILRSLTCALCAAVLAWGGLASTAYADAVSISVNFGADRKSGDNYATPSTGENDYFGAFPVNGQYWNNASGKTGSMTLISNTGAATGVSGSWESSTTYNGKNFPSRDNNAILFYGYLDDGTVNSHNAYFSMTAPYFSYDIYYYAATDVTSGSPHQYATINSYNYCGGSTGTVLGTSNWGTPVTGNLAADGLKEGVNYLKVSSSDPVISIYGAPKNGSLRGSFGAVQIVNTANSQSTVVTSDFNWTDLVWTNDLTSETEQAFDSSAIGYRLIYNGTADVTINLNNESISMDKIRVLGTGTGTIKYSNGTVALGVPDTVTDYTSQPSLFDSVALGKVAPRSVVKFAPGAATASENESIIPGAYVVDGSSVKFAKVAKIVNEDETVNYVIAAVEPTYLATPTDGMDLLVSTKIGSDNVNRILNSITSEQDYVNNQSLTISSGMMTLQTANHWVQGGGTITSGNLNADGEYDLYLCALGGAEDMRIDSSRVVDNPNGKLNLIKTGSGKAGLTNYQNNPSLSNEYSGKTSVLEGTLFFGIKNSSTQFYVANGATLDFSCRNIKNGSYNNHGDIDFTATELVGYGTVIVGNSTTVGSLTLNNVLYDGSKFTAINAEGKYLTLNNSELHAATVNSSSVINLNNQSTLTADTFISAANSTVKFDATTSNLNAAAIQTAAGSLTFDVPDSRTVTITPSITGAGGVTKVGDGTMVFTSNMSYTGETLINEGTLQLNNTTSAKRFSGPVTIAAGATLKCNAHDSIGYNSEAKVFNIYGTLNNAVQNESLRNTTLNLYGGTISSTSGGTLDILNKDNYSTEDKIFSYALEGATAANPTVSTISSKINLRTNGTLEINTEANSQLKITGVISQGSADYSCTITKLGAGTLTLSAQNTYTNGAIVKEGTLELTVSGGTGAFAKGSPITVDGSTAVLAGHDDILGYTNGAIGSLTLQNGGTFKNDKADAHITVNNVVYMNKGVITAVGEGSTPGAGGAGKYNYLFDNAIHVTGGTNNQINAYGIWLRSLNGTSFADGDSAGLIDVAQGAKLTISSVIGYCDTANSGTTANITKAGAGELVLTGISPFNKNITVNGGVLDLTNGALYTGGYVSNANVYVNDGGTLKVNDFGYAEDGSSSLGGLTYQSNGSTNIHLNGGAIQIQNTYTGTETPINRKVELQANGGTLDILENVELLLAGNINGAGALTKIGAGTLELINPNTYEGGTTISQGVVNLSGSGTLGTGAVAMAENSVLNFNHEDEIQFNNSVSGSGKIYKNGSGVLKILAAQGGFAADSFLVKVGELDFKGYYKGTLEIGDGAIFSPGNSVGSLIQDGTFILDSGALLLIEQDASGIDTISATTFDVKDGAIIDIVGVAAPGAQYTLFTQTSGEAFDDDHLDAFWNGLLTPESAYYWNLSVDGNVVRAFIDGNAVPEPSTWALLILGAAGLLYWRKRRNA